MSSITVSSHVGRDLLQSAALFKDEAGAIWEYVSNSLDYIDTGVTPVVSIEIRPREKKITISDNGRGMDSKDLQIFFTMHGENVDRKRGRKVRGIFGTGKSAAFGIGNGLTVTSIKAGKINSVSLNREQIQSSDGDNIPVSQLIVDQATNLPNGTEIEISGIFLKKMNRQRVIEFIERHLQMYRHIQPRVVVGDHICEYREPSFIKEFNFVPEDIYGEPLGSVNLIIRIAQSPLDSEQRGVAISAGPGNLVAIEKGGVDVKDMGEFLFGELDVPGLDDDRFEMPAYDSTRNMMLRLEHPVAQAVAIFCASKLEEVRKELVADKRKAKEDQLRRKLDEEANRITEIINKDLAELEDRLLDIKTATAKPRSQYKSPGQGEGDNVDGWTKGTQERAVINPKESDKESVEGEPKGRPEPDIKVDAERNEKGDGAIDPTSVTESRRSKKGGGFSVEFLNMGENENRSKYNIDNGKIYINLDHPVVFAAASSGQDDPAFLRLCYEIAFSEYSFAIAMNLVNRDPEFPADEVIYEISSALNRVSRNAASLYRSPN